MLCMMHLNVSFCVFLLEITDFFAIVTLKNIAFVHEARLLFTK